MLTGTVCIAAQHNTQIINPPGPVLDTTHGKATKSFYLRVLVLHAIFWHAAPVPTLKGA